MIEQHYTTREIAGLLSVCEETVLRYAQRGELRSIRIGNDRRYPESAVQEFIDRRADGMSARIVPLRDTHASATRRR